MQREIFKTPRWFWEIDGWLFKKVLKHVQIFLSTCLQYIMTTVPVGRWHMCVTHLNSFFTSCFPLLSTSLHLWILFPLEKDLSPYLLSHILYFALGLYFGFLGNHVMFKLLCLIYFPCGCALRPRRQVDGYFGGTKVSGSSLMFCCVMLARGWEYSGKMCVLMEQPPKGSIKCVLWQCPWYKKCYAKSL